MSKELNYTVELRLTDTPEKWTLTIYRTILKVPTVLPFTSLLKQPLNSGHPATVYNGQFLQSQLHANNTQLSRYSRHSSTFSARLTKLKQHWLVLLLIVLASALYDKLLHPFQWYTFAIYFSVCVEMYGNEDGSVPATFQLLHFIGWKPHQSQVSISK